VEAGDGEPCGSKDARVIDMLETIKSPESSHVEIKASPPKKVAGSAAQLKCIYTDVDSMGNKQDELKATVQLENCDTVAVTDTWWDDPHNRSASMDGSTPFRRDREGRRGDRVSRCVTVCFDCLELDGGEERLEYLWVRIRDQGKGQ